MIEISARPGEWVNRPRYTLNVIVFGCLCLYVRFVVNEANEMLVWHGMHYDLTLFQIIRDLYLLLHFAGITLEKPHFVPLRKAKHVYADFLATTKLRYKGIHTIKLTNVSAILHPVDWFLKQYYQRYWAKFCAQAFATYKRTNPTLELKLEYLEAFAEPHIGEIPIAELRAATLSVVDDVLKHAEFHNLCREIKENVGELDFDSLNIDGSSASGYPYKQGNKKRDDFHHACMTARELYHDDFAFDGYMSDHVWYTTGRAKMQGVDDPPGGRLIVYAGFAISLLVMLVLQPWAAFMNRHFFWCGVGFSWMQDGAGRMAHAFHANEGRAPEGYRYVSIDVSKWDTKLHHDLMMMLVEFYTALLGACGVPNVYLSKFITIVLDMINAVILMPLGFMFQVFQGMKSGWSNTANDNTLLHEIVFRCIMKRLGSFILHVLYGDDNFMLVPDGITDEMLVEHYEAFGLKVKRIHSSRLISDVDFLSKHIVYANGHYYVYREAVETHSRLLMPEETDPRRRNRPDVIIAIERVLGHLLDNPFNVDVRCVCYDLLERFRRSYEIHFFDVNDDVMKKHPWRNFDSALIPRKFPIVPSMRFIEELYGVPIPQSLRMIWPDYSGYISYGGFSSSDTVLYDVARQLSDDVMVQLTAKAGKFSKNIVRKLSPFKQPVKCYGFHAARFEFAIKYFEIRFNNLLDLGSHPGACAASATKYCTEIVCVSRKPHIDKRAFCPYVARDTNITLIREDADHYVVRRPFDLQHDDVDLIGPRSMEQDIQNGLGMIRRARVNKSMLEQALFTLKDVDDLMKDELYALYTDYGYIDFVRPLFSNPWKSEIMVYVRKEKTPRIRRFQFRKLLNGFLNAMAPQLFAWSDALARVISNYQGVASIEANPNQTDSYESEWIRDWGPLSVQTNLTILNANVHKFC